MKRLLALALISFLAPLSAEEPSAVHEHDIAAVEHLIQITTLQLEKQKELKALMLEFREQQDQFFQGDQSKAHASKMVITAHKILEMIKQSRIHHLFSSDYLEELALFSSIANKSAPARP